MNLNDIFAEETKTNDKIIQMSLREIDMRNLANAMLGYSELGRQAVFRNMPKRAMKSLLKDMNLRRDQTPVDVIDAASQFFNQKLRKNARLINDTRGSLRKKIYLPFSGGV